MTGSAPPCVGKAAYADKGHADRVAKRQRRNENTNSQAYRCRTCRVWHVGTSIIPHARATGGRR